MRFIHFIILFLFCIFFSPEYTNAASRFAVTSGNWSGAIWAATAGGSAGSAATPTSSDAVTINGNVTVTVDISTAACASLSINPSNSSQTGTLSFNSSTILTVSGNITVGGTGTKAGSINMSSGGALLLSGSFTINNLNTFTAGSGTIEYNASGAQTVTTGLGNYNNLTLSGSGAKTVSGVTVNGILSMSGSATASTAPTYGSSATLQYNTTMTAGPEWISTFAATGGVVINSGTVTLNAAKTFNSGTPSVPLTINSGATLTTNNFGLTFGGDFINNSGTFTSGSSSSITINGSVAQNIAGFSTTGTVSMTKTGGAATFTGNVSGGSLTINGSGGTLDLGSSLTHTFTGTWTRTDGTLNGASSTLKLGAGFSGTGGTFTASTGTVEWNASGAQTIAAVTYNNLTLSGSGAKDLTGVTAVNGNLTLSGTATATTAANFSIGGNLVVGDGTTFTVAGFDITVTGTTTLGGGTSGNLTISSATGTKIFTGLVTVATGGTWTNTSANSAVTFRGGITNNGTFNSGTGIHTFDTNSQSISGTFAIPNVTVTSITLTNNNTLTVSTALSGTGTFSQASNATLIITGSSGISTISASNSGNTVQFNGSSQTIPAFNYHHLSLTGATGISFPSGTVGIAGTFTIGSATTASTGTIDFNGSGAQTIPVFTYNNLSTSTGGTKTLAGATTINSAISIGASSTLDVSSNNYAITASGNWSSSGTFTAQSSTVTMNGSSAQTINGSSVTAFYNLTINNSNGITLGVNASVNGGSNALTLTSGKITTGSYTLALGNIATISGASSSQYVYGNLQMGVATGSNVARTFEIGDNSKYTPVSITFASVSGTTGSILAYTTGSDHSQISASTIHDNKNTNRYWTITNNSVTFTTFDIVLNFDAADVDAGATPTAFEMEKYNGTTWTRLTHGTRTASSTQAVSVSSFSDFAVGENAAPPTINTNLSNQTICSPNSIAFTASVNSDPASTVVWQINPPGGFGNLTITSPYSVNTSSSNGVTTSILTINPSSTPLSGNQYRAVFTNVKGSVTTSAATLTVNTVPAITSCPSNVSLNIASNEPCVKVVNYTVTASGTPSPTFTYSFTGATVGSGSGTGSGATFNKGVTYITATASNGCSPNAVCSFTITISDNLHICPQFVLWTDLDFAYVNADSLFKNGPNGWAKGGAASENLLKDSTDGWVRYIIPDSISSTQTKAFGLSDLNVDANYTTIDYAFVITGGKLYVYENGSIKASAGNIYESDSLLVERIVDSVYYRKNGVELYKNTSGGVRQKSLIVDAAISDSAATFISTTCSFDVPGPILTATIRNQINDTDSLGLIFLTVSGEDAPPPYEFIWDGLRHPSQSELTTAIDSLDNFFSPLNINSSVYALYDSLKHNPKSINLLSGKYEVAIIDSLDSLWTGYCHVGKKLLWKSGSGINMTERTISKRKNGYNTFLYGSGVSASKKVADGWNDGYLVSKNILGKDKNFYLEFSVPQILSQLAVGLKPVVLNSAVNNLSALQIGFLFDNLNGYKIIQRGLIVSSGIYKAGDVFAIERTFDSKTFRETFTYFRNGFQVAMPDSLNNYFGYNSYRLGINIFDSAAVVSNIIVLTPSFGNLNAFITESALCVPTGKLLLDLRNLPLNDSLEYDFSYIWSTGDSTSALFALNPGVYTVTVEAMEGQNRETFIQPFTVPAKLRWTELESMAINDSVEYNEIKKVSGTQYGWDARARSRNFLKTSQSGWIKFKTSSSNDCVFGLSGEEYVMPSVNYGAIAATYYPDHFVQYPIRLLMATFPDAGVTSTPEATFLSAYRMGDEITIKRTDSVRVFKNTDSIPMFTFTNSANYNLFARAFIYTNNKIIEKSTASFDCGDEINYAGLKIKPDGSYYKLANNKLRFTYTEEYTSGTLDYKIYDSQRNQVTISGCVSNYNLSKLVGYNNYELDFSSCSLASGYYTLEVIGEKKQFYVLRFKK